MAREVRLTMRLVDQVSGPGKMIQGALRGLNATAQSLGSMAMAPARAVGQMSRAARRSAGEMTVMSAGVGMGVAGIAKDIYNMEKSLNVSVAAGGLDMKQRNEFMAEAIRLNAEYAATATEIVDAGNKLLRAGLSYDEMMGSLPGVLSTAQAMDVDMEAASKAIVNSMVSMRMEMKDTESTMKSSIRIADLYAHAVNETTGELEDFAVSSRYFNPVAAAMGMSPEDAMGLQIALAKGGIMGSSAGTALRAAPVRIAAPSPKAMAAMNRLGIDPSQFVNSGKRTVTGDELIAALEGAGFTAEGMEDAVNAMIADPAFQGAPHKLANAITDQFREQLGIATAEDQQAIGQILTNAIMAGTSEVDLMGFLKAMSAAGAGVADYAQIIGLHHASKMQAIDPEAYDEIMRNVYANAEGTSKRMREAMMSGIVGDVAELTAAVEKMSIMIGKAGLLSDGARALQAMAIELDHMADSSPALLRFGSYAAIALAAMAPLGFAIAGIAGTLAFMLNPLVLVGAAMAGLAALNWRPLLSGFRTLGTFFRLDLSPSTVARFGRLKESMKGFVSGLSDSSAMARFQAVGARLGTGLANIVNAVANYDFGPRLRGMAESIRIMGMSRVDGIIGVGRAIGDLMERGGPFFTTAFQSIATGVGSGLDAVGSALQVIASISSQAATGVTNFFTAFTSGISDETLAILGRGANSLLAEFARDLQNLNTELQGYKTAIDGLDMGWFSGFGGDAARGFNQIVLEFSQMPDAIQAEVNRYAEIVRGMGQYVPDFSGIIGAVNGVVSVIRSIVGAVNEAIAALERFNTNGMVAAARNAVVGMPGYGNVPDTPRPSLAPALPPGKAGGGVVRRGHLYEINERGQEYFSPGSNGRIIPNHRLGGNGNSGRIVVENKVYLDSKPIVAAVRRDESRRMSRKKQTGLNRPME